MMFLIIIPSEHMNICESCYTKKDVVYHVIHKGKSAYLVDSIFVKRIQFLEETLHLNTSDPELPGNPRNTFFYIYYLFSHNFVTS